MDSPVWRHFQGFPVRVFNNDIQSPKFRQGPIHRRLLKLTRRVEVGTSKRLIAAWPNERCAAIGKCTALVLFTAQMPTAGQLFIDSNRSKRSVRAGGTRW